MKIWHLTQDAPRRPRRISPQEPVQLRIGSWPIGSGQAVWVTYHVVHPGGARDEGTAAATWVENRGDNSYWRAEIGPFKREDTVTYRIHGRAPEGEVAGPTFSFRVGPNLYLAILWHQHQPIYKDAAGPEQEGSYLYPWVRLHALRDYFAMANLLRSHPDVHVTFNLTPALLWQLEDYVVHGATDRALELTLKPAEALTDAEREEVLATFFQAHWHHRLCPYPRYAALFAMRRDGAMFTNQELRDTQMWFNLAWFGQAFREGSVALPTGETASVQRFVEQGSGFTPADIEAMVAEQYKIMRAVVPIHRELQARGQIEVSTTPFYHPILPLLIDSDLATLDRPEATRPPRFAYPEDAAAQAISAVRYYRDRFGAAPRGMWPAEGAVGQSVIPFFADVGVQWIASDRHVLARSGRWGYDTDDPDVLCQPYRAVEGEKAVTIFFRDTALSDAIGFHYCHYDDDEEATRDFVNEIRARFVERLTGDDDRILTVILDGENAWGAYRHEGRPFLRALYRRLAQDPTIETVTPSEYLEGNTERDIPPHPVATLPRVYDLFTGSWIDEAGSRPGVDLGTWIGEGEENRGWHLLLDARRFLETAGGSASAREEAFEAIYQAEGSDWFWWFGADQESGHDEAFDDLFRMHLRRVYQALDATPPPALYQHIVPHAVVWTFTDPVDEIQAHDRLTVQTHCPGVLTWQSDGVERTSELVPAGGVMAGISSYAITLGPFSSDADEVRFRFLCRHENCDCQGVCCLPRWYRVSVVAPAEMSS